MVEPQSSKLITRVDSLIRSTQSLEKKKGVLDGTPFAYLPYDCFDDWVCWTCRDSGATIAIQRSGYAQTQGNKVTEVVDGVVEQVDVSKHPTASIEASDLSLADIERRKSHPGHWALFIALVLVALIAPYWWGRVIAVKDAAWMVANLSFLDPKGVALISWTVTIMRWPVWD